MTNNIRSKGWMDAEKRWWVAELLGADSEKAWLNPGEEETMHKWYAWLEKMRKEDQKGKMEEMHQQRVIQMIKSAEGSAEHLHKITKPTARRGGAPILKKEEEDVRLLDRCEAKRNAWAKHWHCNESVQNMEEPLWTTKKLKKVQKSSVTAKRVRVGEGVETVQGKNRSGMRWLSPKSPSGLNKRNKGRRGGTLGKKLCNVEIGRNELARRCSA